MATGAVPAQIPIAGATFDSTLFQYSPGSDGTRLEMFPEIQVTDNFADLSQWTETDSGGKVNLAGGIVSLDGNGSWAANAIHRVHDLSTWLPSIFEIKAAGFEYANDELIGLHVANALVSTPDIIYMKKVANHTIRTYVNAEIIGSALGTLTPDDFYLLRWYFDPPKTQPSGAGQHNHIRATIEGDGFDAGEQLMVDSLGGALQDIATICFQVHRREPDATDVLKVKEYRFYSGYSTADPVVDRADINSGAADSVWDMSTIAWPTSSTGIEYRYAYGNGASPANWSAYMNLAALQAETDPAGQYLRINDKVSSDGVTQRYLSNGVINVGIVGVGGVTQAPFKPPWMA